MENIDLTGTFYLCWIDAPVTKYLAGYSEPFSIEVTAPQMQLTIELSQYNYYLLSSAECGAIIYEASASSTGDAAFEPFSQ